MQYGIIKRKECNFWPSHHRHTLVLDFVFLTNAPVGETVPHLAVSTVGAIGRDASGRVQQWSQQSRTSNTAERGTVWPTGHWWRGRAQKRGCVGPKIALPHIS